MQRKAKNKCFLLIHITKPEKNSHLNSSHCTLYNMWDKDAYYEIGAKYEIARYSSNYSCQQFGAGIPRIETATVLNRRSGGVCVQVT